MKNLILLHGALGSEKQLQALKNELTNFNVYTMNFEGHGGRSINGSYSIDRFVQNVLDFMSANQLQSAAFFGYSMGGYVALKLAQIHPEKVDEIITYGTKFDWTIEKAAKEVHMLNPEKIEEKIPQYADFLKHLHQPLNWKVVMDNTAKMMTSLGDNPSLKEEDLKSINTKATICVGSKDQMITIEESEKAANFLLNGKLHVFENFEHPIDKVDIESLSKFIKMKLMV
jgi:pimeloyl-ACP methyl ester carboxylesterase